MISHPVRARFHHIHAFFVSSLVIMTVLDCLDSRALACMRSFLVESLPGVAAADPDDLHMRFGRAQSAARWRAISRFMVHTMEWHADLNSLNHEHLICFNAYLRDLYELGCDSDGNLRESYGPDFESDWE